MNRTLRKKLAVGKQLFQLVYCELYDLLHFVMHSSVFSETSNEQKLASRISMATHGIEKGLTMPNMRLGFGQDAVFRLIDLCQIYKEKKFDISNILFAHALSVLNEYRILHENCGEKSPSLSKINDLLGLGIPFENKFQKEYTNSLYFAKNTDSFDTFSESRHSVRNFSSKAVNNVLLSKAISLAMNSPSSCNRQVTRLHVIENSDLKQCVLKVQQGNRGFGEYADKILIVTANTESYASGRERNAAYVDAGMFGMNLLYSLHYHEIASCTLNCYFTPSDENKIKKNVGIPANEVLVMILLIGNVSEKFKIAYSIKQDYKRVTTFH